MGTDVGLTAPAVFTYRSSISAAAESFFQDNFIKTAAEDILNPCSKHLSWNSSSLFHEAKDHERCMEEEIVCNRERDLADERITITNFFLF